MFSLKKPEISSVIDFFCGRQGYVIPSEHEGVVQEFEFMLVFEEMSGLTSQTCQLFAADGFTAES